MLGCGPGRLLVPRPGRVRSTAAGRGRRPGRSRRTHNPSRRTRAASFAGGTAALHERDAVSLVTSVKGIEGNVTALGLYVARLRRAEAYCLQGRPAWPIEEIIGCRSDRNHDSEQDEGTDLADASIPAANSRNSRPANHLIDERQFDGRRDYATTASRAAIQGRTCSILRDPVITCSSAIGDPQSAV